jgi:hypothetical protein
MNSILLNQNCLRISEPRDDDGKSKAVQLKDLSVRVFLTGTKIANLGEISIFVTHAITSPI